MSILVRGMKMPNEPRNCKFYDIDPMGFRKPYCKVQSVCNGLEDCPLIEVPELHGRLIDADALSKSLDKLCDRVCQYSKAQRDVMCGACPLGDAFSVVEDEAPTIIPASEVGT